MKKDALTAEDSPHSIEISFLKELKDKFSEIFQIHEEYTKKAYKEGFDLHHAPFIRDICKHIVEAEGAVGEALYEHRDFLEAVKLLEEVEELDNTIETLDNKVKNQEQEVEKTAQNMQQVRNVLEQMRQEMRNKNGY